jgi:hypothetical protein
VVGPTKGSIIVIRLLVECPRNRPPHADSCKCHDYVGQNDEGVDDRGSDHGVRAMQRAALDCEIPKVCQRAVKAISAWMGNPDASCSATRRMAGQRHPDGRSLRVIKMAWRLRSDKRFLPRLGGDGMSGRFGIGQILPRRPIARTHGFVHNASALHTTPPAHQQQPRWIFIYSVR